jgi:hypothetical protein
MTHVETQTHSTHIGNVEFILRRMRHVNLLTQTKPTPGEPSFSDYGTYIQTCCDARSSK